MFSYVTFSDKGDRKNNEDCVGAFSGAGGHMFVLCDGLGGHGAGEVASATAVQAVQRVFSGEVLPGQELLTKCVATAQTDIYNIQQSSLKFDACKTTITLLHIKDGVACYAHVGDSRIYTFERHKIVKRTLDHSVPQMLVLQGEIKEKDIRFHEDRNRLVRVLGNDAAPPKLDMSEPTAVRPSQRFLMCSDGFWEWLDEKDMMRCLKGATSPQDFVSAMTSIVMRNGAGKNMDNYSAIAVFC